MNEPIGGEQSVAVDFYPRDGSVFLDTHYLIKGVAGALFWKLVREHQQHRRREFSLRELRLAGHELRLPEVQDNLSVRMLLLQRRLADRDAPVRITKVGRGRFRLDPQRPLSLREVAGPEAGPSSRPAPPDAGPAPVPVDLRTTGRRTLPLLAGCT